jgi:hypothetical protein
VLLAPGAWGVRPVDCRRSSECARGSYQPLSWANPPASRAPLPAKGPFFTCESLMRRGVLCRRSSATAGSLPMARRIFRVASRVKLITSVAALRLVEQGSFGHMITTESVPEGRGAGSLTWAGIYNTYYWIDPKKRIAAVFMTQVLPFADQRVSRVYRQFERSAAIKAGYVKAGYGLPEFNKDKRWVLGVCGGPVAEPTS